MIRVRHEWGDLGGALDEALERPRGSHSIQSGAWWPALDGFVIVAARATPRVEG